MTEVIEVIFRTFIAFVLLVGTAHILGKQTIAQMNYHDFIATIMIGAIAGNLAFNTGINSIQIITALVVFAAILYVTTLISLKNRKARLIFSGEPTVLIQNGKILEKNIKKLRFSYDSFNQALREKDVFDMAEVEYCVMEADGHLSILKKQPYRTVVKKDIGLFSTTKSMFPLELIMDGKVIEQNFKENQLTKDWFSVELNQRNINLEQVNYCVRGTNGQLYFDLYEDGISTPIDRE